MFKSLAFVGLLLLVGCPLFNACQNEPNREAEAKAAGEKIKDGLNQTGEGIKDVANETAEALDDTGEALKAERDTLESNIKRQTRALDAELAELDRKMANASAKEKVRWQERRTKLAEERSKLDIALQELGSDMKRGWNEFKADVDRTMKNISKELDGDK